MSGDDELISAISRQIDALQAKIGEMTAEKAALERLLLKARQSETIHREAVRKNSVQRILVERNVIETLQASTRPVHARELLASVQSSHLRIKPPTFRSHLMRMKERGLIKPARMPGSYWLLGDVPRGE